MIVTAMLAWFDEPVDLLETAVQGAAVVADRLVAADGAYEQVPDRAESSPPEQKRAIAKAAKRVGLDVSFLRPRVWSGQVEKRDAILREAQKGSDWVFPLDADWRISGDRDRIRAEMEASTVDSLSVRFFQPVNPERPTIEIAPHEWHLHQAGNTERMPILMRVYHDMRVEKLHWVYSGVKNGHRVGYWGGAHYYVSASVSELQAPHLFEHRCLFRDQKQLERNRVFCELRDRERDMTGVER